MDKKGLVNVLLSAIAAGLGAVSLVYTQTDDTNTLIAAFTSAAGAAVVQQLRKSPLGQKVAAVTKTETTTIKTEGIDDAK